MPSFICCTIGQKFESEAVVTEEMLDREICSGEQFSLKAIFISGTFQGSVCHLGHNIDLSAALWKKIPAHIYLLT